jgi:predicted metal-dependent HD superfamily phosphohydrolase
MDLQSLLDRWDITLPTEEAICRWNEPHRKYHSITHLQDLWGRIDNLSEITEKERDLLYLTALFHDIVYDPQRDDNELQSVLLLRKHAPKTVEIQQIADIILDTQHHTPRSLLARIFCELDMSVVEAPYERLLEWEEGIAFEYAFLTSDEYTRRRVRFLQAQCLKYPHNYEAFQRLIQYVEKRHEDYDIVLEFYETLRKENMSPK